MRPAIAPLLFGLSLLASACDTGTPGGSAAEPASSARASGAASGSSGATATLDLYVMSKCPYGVKVEQALVPVKQKLGDSLKLHFDYIGKGEAGSLTSMHGDGEVKGDIAQLCAAKQMGDAVLDFIACQNENPREVDTNWKSCAESNHLDVAALQSCIEGDEGQQLLAASFERSKKKKATGSPTIYLNGKRYRGGRGSNQLLRAICAEFDEGAPQACADLPEPPAVDVVFLSDSRCEKCDLHPVEPRLKGDLLGAKVRYLDYGTPEGKAFYDEIKAADPSFSKLPAIFVAPAVEKDEDGYPKLKRYLKRTGDWYRLQMKATFDPTAEICDNGVDDDGNGAVDCADPGCREQLVCREEKPGKLDLYVMSHCPYGAKAMIATDAVMKQFGDDIDLDLHYIGNGDASSLSSMHGPTEVDDDIREVCAQEHAPDRALSFAACISRDYKNADWEACADEAGIPRATIADCFENEGRELLARSFAESADIGFSASPTFLVNNKRSFNAIDPKKLQAEICKDNPGLAGCGAEIAVSEADAKPVPAGQCN